MQIVSLGHNLHKMLKPIFREKYKKQNKNSFSSADLAELTVKVKMMLFNICLTWTLWALYLW